MNDENTRQEVAEAAQLDGVSEYEAAIAGLALLTLRFDRVREAAEQLIEALDAPDDGVES